MANVLGAFIAAVGLGIYIGIYDALQFLITPCNDLMIALEPWSGQLRLMFSIFFAAAIWIGFFTFLVHCVKGMRILLGAD